MKKILIVIGLGLLIALFFIFDLGQYFTLSYIKSQQVAFEEYYTDNPLLTIGIYSLIYIVNTAASLPTAAILTLLGGALFGVFTGTLVVSFASTIGATLAFLASRYVLRDWVQQRFSDHMTKINKGVEKEGAFYLFSLRLIPAIPFFVINLVMGVTRIKTRTYFFASQLGMLPGTIVFVNAGTQLSQIESLSGILSPSLILSFILLALFPLMSKKVMTQIRKKSEKANAEI